MKRIQLVNTILSRNEHGTASSDLVESNGMITRKFASGLIWPVCFFIFFQRSGNGTMVETQYWRSIVPGTNHA